MFRCSLWVRINLQLHKTREQRNILQYYHLEGQVVMYTSCGKAMTVTKETSDKLTPVGIFAR